MNIQKIAIKGLVVHKDSVFMLKDQSENWELPGGKIDFGESPEKALRREFKEELNIEKIDIGDMINVWDFTTKSGDDDYHFIIIIHRCYADLDNIRMSDEHLEAKWIKINEVNKYPMRDGYKEAINKISTENK